MAQSAQTLESMKAAPSYYKSKTLAWSTPGNGDYVWDNSFIPVQGPNGGINVIDRIVVHGAVNRTVGTAVLLGEDAYRIARRTTITQKDGEKRFSDVFGDACRLISYAHNGSASTHEHQDEAVDTSDMNVTVALPLAKIYSHSEDDTSLPAWMLDEVRVAQPTNADLSIGTSVVTLVTGTFWLIAECHEERTPVLHAVDSWTQNDTETTTAGTIQVNGRLKDLYLMVRGATGGASLANITDAKIDQLQQSPLLRMPDLNQIYNRARGGATNLFSTKGNPLRTDPFQVSDSGTMRALAVLLATGDKVWEGPEQRTALLRLSLGGALTPITMISRATRRKTKIGREMIMDLHKCNASVIVTSGKTKRQHKEWDPIQAAYMPEEFYRTDGRPVKLFSGQR